LIGLLDKYLSIVYHHQLLAADIQLENHTTVWITLASFTDDVGVVDKKTKTRMIDAGHMNGYLIIPGIAYHLSTKLQKGVTHDHLGQDTEVKLIEFLARFGYATRKLPTVQLHATHTHYCFDVNETKYIQGRM
jgi:hypothetical protein